MVLPRVHHVDQKELCMSHEEIPTPWGEALSAAEFLAMDDGKLWASVAYCPGPPWALEA
jgi:hypothetical protein